MRDGGGEAREEISMSASPKDIEEGVRKIWQKKKER